MILTIIVFMALRHDIHYLYNLSYKLLKIGWTLITEMYSSLYST